MVYDANLNSIPHGISLPAVWQGQADPEATRVIAPLPAKLVERGIASPGLLAHIAISKFQDHLPLYRQEQNRAARSG